MNTTLAEDYIDTAAPEPTETPTVTTLPTLIDVASFVALDLPEPKQIVKGLLHQGSKMVLGGGSKSFKTWVLLYLALAVAFGKRWLSFETTQGKVLYVNFEIQDFSWQQRIQVVAQAMGITLEPDRIQLLNLRGKAANHTELLPHISEAISGKGFALIVLDPIYKLYGSSRSENDTGDMAELMNGLERLAVESGAAVAFGAHFSKGNQAGKESIDRISGSGVFARDPDSLVMMTRHQENDCFTVEATLRNFPQVEPFVVQWHYPLMEEVELDPAKLKQIGGRKKEYLAEDLLSVLSVAGMTTTEWNKAAKEERLMGERTCYNLRKELTEAGLVLKSRINGKWQPVKK